MTNDLKKYLKERKVYTLEDTNDFVHYATSSKKDLARHIARNKEKYNKEQYIVCEYPSVRSLVPNTVVTVKSFVVDFNLKDTWKLGRMIRNLIG